MTMTWCSRFGSGVARFQVLYAGGSGTRELSFATPLAAQFTDTDGVSVPAGSLTLIGATTLKGPYGRDAVLTHGAYGFPGHLVNALPDPPRITNMSLAVEVPDRGYFETGDLVLIEAEFTAPVFLGGSGGAYISSFSLENPSCLSVFHLGRARRGPSSCTQSGQVTRTATA